MAIFVTGDTHGIHPCGYDNLDGFKHRFSRLSFPEQKKLTKDDYVVICGDFGGVWDMPIESKAEKEALDWLNKKNFTTLFVPGNHENYDRLTGLNNPALLDSWLYKNLTDNEKLQLQDGYPQKFWHGGMVREIRPSVLMLERGYVFDINGHKCFAFGGAASHDIYDGILKPEEMPSKKEATQEYKNWVHDMKVFRVNHVSWWEQEMPSSMEMEHGLAVLEDENYKVDFIFTHDASTSTKIEIMNADAKPDKLSKYFETIKTKVEYKKWFFGHLHGNRMCSGGKDILLYEQIIKIAE